MRIVIAFVCIAFGWNATTHAQVKLGATGDSLMDEYFEQSGAGQSLGYSRNFLELMIDSNRIDMGTKSNWGDSRQTGYEFNWALAGSTTENLIDDNQHTNLANQIPVKGITKAILIIGSNDLFPVPPTGGAPSDYEAIYEGLADQTTINIMSAVAIDRVVLAAETLKNTGVDLVVGTAPEYGISRFAKHFYPDASKRAEVDNVYEARNAEATRRLTEELQVPVVDIYGLTKDIWGDHGSENLTFNVGGVDFDLNGTGGVDFPDVVNGTFDPTDLTSDTTDVWTHDGIHPNSAAGGIFANLFMTAFNQEYGDSFTLFSEQEILSNAGPNLGAMFVGDTLQASLGGKTYSSYVISAVPEPAGGFVIVTVAFGCACGLRSRRRRRYLSSANSPS